MEQYVRPEDARRILKVSDDILRKWAKSGKIEYIRIGKGTHRRYKISNFIPPTNTIRRKICYARVSSVGQKEDLEQQTKYLKQHYPTHELVTDIGSGLNFKRKGFKTILESAIRGDIEEIVVTYRDRLCRFGFDLVEWFILQSKGKIVVLNDDRSSPQEELVKDLLSIITVFSSRVHGLRKYKKQIQTEINPTENTENTSSTEPTGEE